MTISNKKQINRGVKNLSAKVMSWSQVCKALSGIGGTIEIENGKKVRPLELMRSLGVHVLKNSYTPKDIFTAWSARMMNDGKVQIMREVPYMVTVDGKDYALNTPKDGKYRVVRQQVLCNLVSKLDKTNSTDVVVNTNNVLRGLEQSVFISDTLAKMQASAEKCEGMTTGWINMTEKKTDAPVWIEVVKGADGNWSLKVEETKKGKKGGRKAA